MIIRMLLVIFPGGAYTLLNAKVSLTNISVGGGQASISLWGRNITDEEYPVLAFNTSSAIVYAYGDPRMAGVELVYQY